jgi:hypothetical protein
MVAAATDETRMQHVGPLSRGDLAAVESLDGQAVAIVPAHGLARRELGRVIAMGRAVVERVERLWRRLDLGRCQTLQV